MTIDFTIFGNHEDPGGNPLAKIKRTRNQYWTPEAQRYAEWKSFVQSEFIAALNEDTVSSECVHLESEKPIILGKRRARMDIKIWWGNGRHADAENVFGSIADALFQNDKNLDGSFAGEMSPDGKGRVEVKIEIK